ncbi:hypothetical protein XENTR_v10024135 [Xenopus tropicalis]|nr:lysine-rich nucleolar protein 1 [Xenopus tropicalis]KAE8579659.1 hypothetical protein XENTR_v10024135 [Xenopus tropicalis]|eukprot:XP_002932260.1 PREDICTED: lysine-rich nucleolar protein 1 [Xenopus tropicalis]
MVAVDTDKTANHSKSKEKKKKKKAKLPDLETDDETAKEMQDNAKVKGNQSKNAQDEGGISAYAEETISKKKRKKVSPEMTEQTEVQGDTDILAGQAVTERKLTGKIKKRKKNKEHSSDTEITELNGSDKLSDPVSCVNDAPNMVEKKEKIINSVPETETELSSSFNMTGTVVNRDSEVLEGTKKQKRKKKKRKDYTTNAESANFHSSNKEPETEKEPETSQKFSKRKNKSLISENAEAAAETNEHVKLKKKEIKKKKDTEEKELAGGNSDTDLSKKKRKKKKVLYNYEKQNEVQMTQNNNIEADCQPPNRNIKKKVKVSSVEDDCEVSPEMEEADSDKDPNGNKIDSGSKRTGSKKKRKCVEEMSDSLTTATCSNEHMEMSKQKKKKKGVADVTVPGDQTTTIEENEAEVPKKRKIRKLGESEVANDFAQSKKIKKAKISKEKVPETSVEEKNASGPGNTKGTRFGQWDTASFQTSDQQAKFFRLMGGFKKGNQSAVALSPSQSKANMALAKTEEQSLQRNLQAEFDKALCWKQNRGIGLGFETAKKKIFFIDKTASKSIKFD